MPKCIVDGKEVEFQPGQTVIEVAKNGGVHIPYFCYHPGLSVVAQCRMCAVEVEKMPKLQTACSTPATEGMVIKTKSPRTLQNQKSVMEFLLINHPLDCPICDKSGECDLQDYSYEHGDAYSRYTEERRTYLDLDMGPVIKKNMNRCIHCTRCIRFGDEIAGIHEMVAVQRGNNTTITTVDGRPLETDYAGNYADICPTGSLTLKDFRFKKRAWMLKKTPTICEGCSKGCNMEADHENNIIHRCLPRENLQINKYWLCDEGRFNFRYLQDKERIVEPSISESGVFHTSSWSQAIQSAQKLTADKKVSILMGSDLTQEEAELVQKFKAQFFPNSNIFHFGTPGILKVEHDAPADPILKRKSKTANLNGLEKLGIQPFDTKSSLSEIVLVFRGGRATLPELNQAKTIIGMGVFLKSEIKNYSIVLPGIGFTEKDGTVFNYEGTEQKFKRAVLPPRNCKALSETLMLFVNQKHTVGALS